MGLPAEVEPAAELRTPNEGAARRRDSRGAHLQGRHVGKTTNRPGWLALLSHVRRNDEVRVDGLDRLGRSTLATLQVMEEFELRGVRVRSAKPREDLAGATGVLIRQLMLVMAQWERRQMLERVAEARAARIAVGLSAGRPKTALGEAQIRHVRVLRDAGYSVKQIVADLCISRASVYRALALCDATESAENPG